MTFTGGNPPTGGNLIALGTATHLGQGIATGVFLLTIKEASVRLGHGGAVKKLLDDLLRLDPTHPELGL